MNFQITADDEKINLQSDITLRDIFAGLAMCALIASKDPDIGDRIVDVPEYAFDIADAMLEERDMHEEDMS